MMEDGTLNLVYLTDKGMFFNRIQDPANDQDPQDAEQLRQDTNRDNPTETHNEYLCLKKDK
jgi:hypothetical protein